ncbi:nucleotidyl transferase AbiEii/AbiGii toxin family protein [Herbiconiux moechotypicola]|uniref:Nucleotidyl transferase AbiEii/AbiGii toxin family protein n=1 Tax=Herbiconiux moechotypicola TaxID=637393 RepID=A0ABP5Q4I2_9MICO|nr:nucleotidyl transferase AbiEii/AbiGii toxin family protein [Herbiconiux moechotypicola]MCS5728545.1 nucleotidyl transferase AbiEii/AbiGii toxin family protein [Herbiconiux moechotypicola]
MTDDLSSLAHVLPEGTLAAWRGLAPVVPEVAYLSGGTALTAHLRHRVSRDLDFFTEAPFDVRSLNEALSSVGAFAPTLADVGTLNGVFEDTKVQFLDASSQRLLEPTTQFGGVRLASLGDVLATKLKVIQDRGALRDYFDLMILDDHISLEEGLTLLVEKYQPIAPAGLIANVVRGLGYLEDVEDDPSLPLPRKTIEAFWMGRQPEIVRNLAL